MKMFARIRYLIMEGFQVCSISGYDDDSGEENAKLMFVETGQNGKRLLRSEIFSVDGKEMEYCSKLFLNHISRH
jgi:uncharacterized protein YabE (DUF348 family)